MCFKSIRYLPAVLILALSLLLGACSDSPESSTSTSAVSTEKAAEPEVTPAPQPVEPQPAAPEQEAPEPEKPLSVAPQPEPSDTENPVTEAPVTEAPVEAPAPEKQPVVENEISMEIIPMKSDVYDEHTRSIVMFTHEKHFTTHEIGCGDCHHDDKGNPLKDLTLTDTVDTCGTCHSKPGNAPRPKDGQKLSSEEKLAYHAEALHENCIGCHRTHNTTTGTKNAPASCLGCHPKES